MPEDDKNALYLEYQKLVSYMVNQCTNHWTEDMFQIGCLGLTKAINTFQASRGVKFSTYAANCIKNEILRKPEKRKPLSLEYEYDGIALMDKIADSGERADETVLTKVTLEEVIERLYNIPGGEYVIDSYIHHQTHEDIGRKYGVSRSAVSWRIKQILQQLRGK